MKHYSVFSITFQNLIL